MDQRQDTGGFQDGLYEALRGSQASMWTAIPGYVVSFNPEEVTAEIQPTVRGVIQRQDGTTIDVDLPVLPDVPVVFMRGGGVTFTFPVKEGDECLVVFSSRCIDGWWQSGGVQLAPELRMHDINDGFCIVGPQSQPNKISNISTDTAQIRSDDGETYVEINPDDHSINCVTSGDITANAGGNVEADISGQFTGSASRWNVTGDIIVQGDVIANGVSLSTHTHPGDSDGTTGAPNKS